MKLAKQKTVFHESYGCPKSAHQHEMDCPVWSTGATIQDTALTSLSPRHHLYINGTRFLFHICKLLPAFFMERESKEVFLCTYSLKILQKESTNLTNNSIQIFVQQSILWWKSGFCHVSKHTEGSSHKHYVGTN